MKLLIHLDGGEVKGVEIGEEEKEKKGARCTLKERGGSRRECFATLSSRKAAGKGGLHKGQGIWGESSYIKRSCLKGLC